MKTLFVFFIISICFVNCEEEFGLRIPKNVTKTNTKALESGLSLTTKESVVKSNPKVHKNSKDHKDLDTHESFKTYEYALAPIEVQTHYPKIIAEEHTLHELPDISALKAFTADFKQGLPVNEPIILSDSSENYGQTSKAFYGAHMRPKHYGSDVPLYRDDAKEQLKNYLPMAFKPALPMHELSQVNTDTSDNAVSHTRPRPYNIAHKPPYLAPVSHEELKGYGLSLRNQGYVLDKASSSLGRHGLDKDYESYAVDKGYGDYMPSIGHTYGYGRHSHLDSHIPGIPGTPWKDYPLYHSVPQTHFKCRPHSPGYYADVEAGCQVWHFCQLDGRHDRFLCSNGTLFNQKTRVCDWWYNVDCHSSVLKYGVNADLYREPKHNPINQYKALTDQIPVPIKYHSLTSDLHDSGHGLLYAESKVVPQKQLIKRVRKVKYNNKSNSTEPGFGNKKE